MKRFFKKYFWFVLLNLVIFATSIINFPIEKFFIGWDAVSSELNIPLNLTRALTPFWQENYGLGALTGHGFGGTLPHVAITAFFSKIMPLWAVRSSFTFLCFYLGGIGMYFLLSYIIKKLIKDNFYISNTFIPILAFAGSLFYLFNIGTVQVFYIQLEAFIAQFAFLPFLILSALFALDSKNKLSLVPFFILNFIASIQGFIPSLFISYFVGILILCTTYIGFEKNKKSIKKAITLILTSLFANSLWLLPVIYFDLTRAGNFLSSYNNLSTTPHFVELSSKYGNLQNVALLKSYLFDSYELGGYILEPWIKHFQHPSVLVIGYIFFALITIGTITSFIKLKSYYSYFFSLAFLYFFTSLATNTFPFSLITKLGQILSPTYEQAFRTTFTKFGIGMSFLYSVELTLALFILLSLVVKLKKWAVNIVFLSIVFLSILWLVFPVFSGNLLYKKLQLTIPKAYFELSSFLNQKPNARIADFPQYCESGWYAYNWGYFGSGFMWYSIKQPFLSRTFDVWSNDGENYYWEISQALDQKDFVKASNILKKYDVTYVLYDPNEISCSTQKGIIGNKEFVEFLKQHEYKVEGEFKNGVLYPITLLSNKNSDSKSFISFYNSLQNVGPFTQWLDSDTAGIPYMTNEKASFDAYFPFRSLLTKRGIGNGSEPKISEKNGQITFTTKLPSNLNEYSLNMPDIKSFEKIINGEINMESDGQGNNFLYLQLIKPIATIDNKKVSNSFLKYQLGSFYSESPEIQIYVNGQNISMADKSYPAIFSTNSNNIVDVLSNGQLLFTWNSSEDQTFQQFLSSVSEYKISLPQDNTFSISIPLTTDNKFYGTNNIDIANTTPIPCNEIGESNRNIFEINTAETDKFVRMISNNSSQCLKINLPDLVTDQGYILSIKVKNNKGNLPKTSIYNNSSLIYSDVTTGIKNKITTVYYVIPPSSPNSGYNIEIENASANISSNDIYNVSLYPISYNFIKNITLKNANEASQRFNKTQHFSVNHKNATHYEIFNIKETGTLVLSQSYDVAWKAYTPKFDTQKSKLRAFLFNAFPFIFGDEIKSHVKVNNWENGWEISRKTIEQMNNKTIIIAYLPQYLEYLSFILFFIPLIYFTYDKIKLLFLPLIIFNKYFESKSDYFKRRIFLRLSENKTPKLFS